MVEACKTQKGKSGSESTEAIPKGVSSPAKSSRISKSYSPNLSMNFSPPGSRSATSSSRWHDYIGANKIWKRLRWPRNCPGAKMCLSSKKNNEGAYWLLFGSGAYYETDKEFEARLQAEQDCKEAEQVGEERARKEFGKTYQLIGESAERMFRTLSIEERLDAMIDKCVKRLLTLRGVKSMIAEPPSRSANGPKLLGACQSAA